MIAVETGRADVHARGDGGAFDPRLGCDYR
jgi:hypothetical protein